MNEFVCKNCCEECTFQLMKCNKCSGKIHYKMIIQEKKEREEREEKEKKEIICHMCLNQRKDCQRCKMLEYLKTPNLFDKKGLSI